MKLTEDVNILVTLHEKCAYSEFFWSVFSPNAGKYVPEKLQIRTFFAQCTLLVFLWECVPLTISYQLYILHLSKIWSMLYHEPVGWVQNKECNFMFTYVFLTHFLLFFIIKFVFLLFSFLFLIKYQNSVTVLTNQKQELVKRNCRWNCVLVLHTSRMPKLNLVMHSVPEWSGDKIKKVKRFRR